MKVQEKVKDLNRTKDLET